MEYLEENKRSDFINLGSGVGTSVFEIISSLNKIGIEVKYELAERRIGDPARLVADITKAKNILNWQPKYLTIDQILDTAVNWHKNL